MLNSVNEKVAELSKELHKLSMDAVSMPASRNVSPAAKRHPVEEAYTQEDSIKEEIEAEQQATSQAPQALEKKKSAFGNYSLTCEPPKP